MLRKATIRSQLPLAIKREQGGPQITKAYRLAALFQITFCTFLAASGYAGELTNATTDLITFFKKAISSPPDVESYTVYQRDTEKGGGSYYVGARAGSNYFLKIVSNSNELLNASQQQPVAGQAGASAYEFSKNAVSYGVGSNGLTRGVEMFLGLTRQFLDMGIGEIRPESVEWHSNAFAATGSDTRPRYGLLIISNGLPFRLKIGNAKGAYKIVDYIYPDPPTALGGFPSKMLIFGESEGKLVGGLEVLICSVRLATEPLAEKKFSPTRFVGPNIAHSNIYRGADLYVQNRLGQLVKAPNSIRRSGGVANSRARTIIFLCFGLITAMPIALFILLHKKTNNNTK